LSEKVHLDQLESEAIYILREVVAKAVNPVMLYSAGKDSSVMVRLAQKAFHPEKIPFPLMHIDTGYKFPEMYDFRDSVCKELQLHLIAEKRGIKGICPRKLGMDKCCQILKTKGLLEALTKYKFDMALGGARREEEKSRAKERIFSVRDKYGQWDPKDQRPELWNLYNTEIGPNQTLRVFPLSNWTEVDIWNYIKQEEIPVVPLYFAKKRRVLIEDNIAIPSKSPDAQEVLCRFRSLGCIPCTGAIISNAINVDDIILEVSATRKSERENRAIDLTNEASMEQKKKEGYF